jgi:DNA polymerase III subunit epsilon
MHQLKLRKPLAFFDLETTGTNITNDRIVEISVVKALPSGEHEVKTKRINPGRPIPAETSMVHGIYDADVADCPTFKQVARSLEQFLDGCDLAGFNMIKFDLPMLAEEFYRAEIDFEFDNRLLVDAQKIFHLMEPRNLSAAYRFYTGQEINTLGKAHSAETDTLATFHVLDQQVLRYIGVEVTDNFGRITAPIVNDMEALHQLFAENSVDLMGRMKRNQAGDVVFAFGKHQGKRVVDVLKQEPSFYDWMMKGDFTQDTKRRLTEIKLKMAFDKVS